MKRVVITGGSGMIGVSLIRLLVERRVYVLAIVRPNSKRKNNIPQSHYVRVIEADLSDLLKLEEYVEEKYDVFFHLAWQGTFGKSRNDMYLQNENIRFTLDAVELAYALGCSTFVGTGSQAEYGRVQGKLSESTSVKPENGYGIAKLCAGQMSRIVCERYAIKHIWTRILSVYGPFDGENTMVMSGILKMLRHEVPQYTKGEQRWDYLYCDDAANALYLAAEKGKNGSVYCIGSGKVRPLADYIKVIRNSIDPDMRVEIGALPYHENQVMYLCADISNLTKDTGFFPQVSFEDGIRKTIEWVKEGKRYEKNKCIDSLL